RVNTEFVRVIDRRTVEMRVWERGSGETYACGTGACATVAACVKNGLADADVPVTVKLIGGELSIICGSDYRIKMTGPATKVYDGVYEYEDQSK
ncbi:MAG: diaminopimelate epimerase, partial [Eubacteriales bacterium]